MPGPAPTARYIAATRGACARGTLKDGARRVFKLASTAGRAHDAALIRAEDACEEEQADHETEESEFHHGASVAHRP